MFVVARSSLFVVCCVLLVVFNVLLRCPLCVVGCLLFAIVNNCLVFVVCWSLCVVCCCSVFRLRRLFAVC